MKLTAPMFAALCKKAGLPQPEAEFRFHPVRKFRWDYCWPDARLALEVDGGIWVRGAHGRGTGIARDQEKLNLATSLGWRLLRVQPKHLADPATLDLIREALTFDVVRRNV